MRCIFVNDANLKARASCAHCHGKIGDNYIREIGTRSIYCGYRCYGDAVERPITTFAYRKGLFASKTVHPERVSS